MAFSSQHEVTQMLLAWNDGDETALARLSLNCKRPGHTLQTAALVNEAFLRLVDSKSVQWQNRAHFFGITAQLMRRIRVDHARRRNQKQGTEQGRQA